MPRINECWFYYPSNGPWFRVEFEDGSDGVFDIVLLNTGIKSQVLRDLL